MIILERYKLKLQSEFNINTSLSILTSLSSMEIYTKIRDTNFYGLPIVTMENCKHFQFATDYGKLEFFYGNLKKVIIRNVAEKKLNKRI